MVHIQATVLRPTANQTRVADETCASLPPQVLRIKDIAPGSVTSDLRPRQSRHTAQSPLLMILHMEQEMTSEVWRTPG